MTPPFDPQSAQDRYEIARGFAERLQFFLARGYGTEEDYCAHWPQYAAIWRDHPRDEHGELIAPPTKGKT